ncbi:hypothetical protein MKL09_21885 [Methylobacterium sp. J-048]|uniref:hypothetical protein n=1 Tax=Methylobacterium sp. J-048 TaxID=2836635 RepID=UPI001FB97B1A|nr:hypothetical protein [Methylobacterium sp. J-048]MCJ2059179.1 hypothetical protein [Methylobacterium sp. J-048]
MIEFDPSSINWISASSLSWDFGGALFLAKALVWNKDNAILRNSEAHFGFNLQLLRSQVEQRTDARYGIAQLFISALIVGASSLGIKADFLYACVLFALPSLFWHQYISYHQRDNLISCLNITRGEPSSVDYWFENFTNIPDDQIVKYYRLTTKRVLGGLADGLTKSCEMNADCMLRYSDQDVKQNLYNLVNAYKDLPEFPQLIGQIRTRALYLLATGGDAPGSNAARFFERNAAALQAIIDEYRPTRVTERVLNVHGRPIELLVD